METPALLELLISSAQQNAVPKTLSLTTHNGKMNNFTNMEWNTGLKKVMEIKRALSFGPQSRQSMVWMSGMI
jgi:hypothetical protein